METLAEPLNKFRLKDYKNKKIKMFQTMKTAG